MAIIKRLVGDETYLMIITWIKKNAHDNPSFSPLSIHTLEMMKEEQETIKRAAARQQPLKFFIYPLDAQSDEEKRSGSRVEWRAAKR